jgi:hypothetical protein
MAHRKPKSLNRMTLALAFLLPLISKGHATAQTIGQWDIIGLKPGMSKPEVMSKVKAHNPSLKIYPQAGNPSADQVNEIAPWQTEQFELYFTTTTHQLFALSRSTSFHKGQEPLITKVLQELRAKFGPESSNMGGFDLRWVVRPDGTRAASYGYGCQLVDFSNWIRPDELSNACITTLEVNLLPSPSNPRLLSSLGESLFEIAPLKQEIEAQQAARNKLKEEEVKKAKGINPPQL